MDETTEPSTCCVAVLVPRTGASPGLLCEARLATSGELRLPTVHATPEPPIPEVRDGIEAVLGVPVTLLRANARSWSKDFDTETMIVEIEPVDLVPADGLEWAAVTEAELHLVQPEWARPTVAGWLAERSDGWSARRPQWSRPGWVSEAGAWMVDAMRAAGFREPRPPTIHYLWGVSVVLSADSRDGRAFLKASSERFHHEAGVTQALADSSPALLPDVVAIEPERGWMLMRDFGSTELGERPADMWGSGLDALAELQLGWLGRGSELLALGAEHRPLDRLASWVEATADDEHLLERFGSDGRSALLKELPEFVTACRQLDDLGPQPTLVHGDFHPWNVAVGDDGVVIFDWTDASLAHPFLDLVTYVGRCRDTETRRTLLQGYLARWRGHMPDADRPDVVDLALVVGALHQAHTYAQLIPTVLPEDLSHLRDGDVEWLQRALRIRADGVAAEY